MSEAKTEFIPSWLDESGLTPSQFRVFCHVSRRGKCFSTTDTIGKLCGIHRETVRRALVFLAKDGLIVTKTRTGQTNIHHVSPTTNKAGVNRQQIRPGGANKSGRGPTTNKADKGSPSKDTPNKVYTKKREYNLKRA